MHRFQSFQKVLEKSQRHCYDSRKNYVYILYTHKKIMMCFSKFYGSMSLQLSDVSLFCSSPFPVQFWLHSQWCFCLFISCFVFECGLLSWKGILVDQFWVFLGFRLLQPHRLNHRSLGPNDSKSRWNLFSVSIYLLFWAFHINGIRQYVFHCNWQKMIR